MQEKYNIPELIIPKTNSKNEFKIFSYNFIYFINNFFKCIKNDIDSEKIISEENNYYNKCFFNGIYNCYNLIIYKLYTKINEKSFWKGLLSERTCDYIYKDGKRIGQICGKSIEIKCTDRDGKYRCAKHISKKLYIPCTKNINKYNLCIYHNNKGKPCRKNKYINGYCIYHYRHSYEENKHKYIDYVNINNEILLFNNIEYDIKYVKKIDIKKDIPKKEDVINIDVLENINSEKEKKLKRKRTMDLYRSIKRKKNNKKNEHDFNFKFDLKDYYRKSSIFNKKEINSILNIILNDIINIRNIIHERNIMLHNYFFDDNIIKITNTILDNLDKIYDNI